MVTEDEVRLFFKFRLRERGEKMRRLLSLLLVGIVLFSALAFAEETFTVSGEVKFPGDGDVIMNLLTKEEETLGKDTPQERILVIKLTPEQRKAKMASFNFIAVPKKAYIIRCFQDVNGNGKLDLGDPSSAISMRDRSTRVSLEPAGLYRSSWPFIWDFSKFQVDRDITGIKIHLEK
jgi:uncharacterized protein (DUF2141 family)